MTQDARTQGRIPIVGILWAVLFGALLLWPTMALGDSLSSGAPPAQYRGPSGDVPGRTPPFFDPPGEAQAPRSAEGRARWEFWFEYEKDALIRRALSEPRTATVTGPSLPAAAGAAPVVVAPSDGDRKQKLLPALRAALKDPSPVVRASSALALGNAGDVDSAPALAEMLRAPVASERRAAALALGFLGGPHGVEDLSRAMETDRDLEVRALAGLALGLTGDEAAAGRLRDALVRSFESSGREVREMRPVLVTALGLLRDRESVPLLQKVLRESRDDRARAHAATALGRVGDAAAVPPLLSALREERDVDVRRSAALALGAFHDLTAEAALLESLEKDGDMLVRGLSAVAYARSAGRGATTRLAALTSVRHDRALRGFAAVALGLTGDPREAGPVLQAILETRSEDSLRSAASVGLGLLGVREASPALRALAADTAASPELRGYALLGAALTGDPAAAVAVKETLTRKAPAELHRAAALAAGVQPFPGSPGILVKVLLEARDPTVRGAALLGLGLAPDRGAVPLLADMAEDGGAVAHRVEAATALGQIALGGNLPPAARLAGGVNYRLLTPALDAATRVF